MGLGFFRDFIPEELSLFYLSGGSLKDPTCKDVCIWWTSTSSSTESLFHAGVQKNYRQVFIFIAARGNKLIFGANNRPIKKV